MGVVLIQTFVVFLFSFCYHDHDCVLTGFFLDCSSIDFKFGRYGSPQAFGPSDVDENIVDEMLSSNMTLANTSNATKITANTKTSDLVRTALPASAMKDAGVRGNIQKAAMKAAMGDGAEGLAALAQATMMAAIRIRCVLRLLC